MKFDLYLDGAGWRMNLGNYLYSSPLLATGDIYQFGVWDGFSMQVLGGIIHLINEQTLLQKNTPTFYGFDIFTGMPTEINEPDKQIDKPGTFNLLDEYNTTDITVALSKLTDDITSKYISPSNLVLTQGLVEQTLPNFTNPNKPALYIDMDLDIYSPSKYTLQHLIKNNIIVVGTIIGYDDWNQNHNKYPLYSNGESRAHKEVCEEFEMHCSLLFETPNQQQAAFLVSRIDKNPCNARYDNILYI